MLPSSGTIWEFTRENGIRVFSDPSDAFLYNTLKPMSSLSVTNIHLHITGISHQAHSDSLETNQTKTHTDRHSFCLTSLAVVTLC